jgi:hypothetical protein
MFSTEIVRVLWTSVTKDDWNFFQSREGVSGTVKTLATRESLPKAIWIAILDSYQDSIPNINLKISTNQDDETEEMAWTQKFLAYSRGVYTLTPQGKKSADVILGKNMKKQEEKGENVEDHVSQLFSPSEGQESQVYSSPESRKREDKR